MASNKEIRQLQKQAIAQGWRIEPTRKGHLKWMPPDREAGFVITASTPSDNRAIKNIVAELRRRGFITKG